MNVESSDQPPEVPSEAMVPPPESPFQAPAGAKANTYTNTDDRPRLPTRKPPSGSGRSTSQSRREAIVLIFVVVFILNSINGNLLMKSINDQLGVDMMEYYSRSNGTASKPPSSKNNTEEVAIIITSSWIPSHPSTYMVDSVYNSTKHLLGLSPTAPIFITIDHFRFSDFNGLPSVLQEKINNLEQYTINLMNTYLPDPRIHIIAAVKNLHIGGNVMKALNLVERHYPSVRYVYYLQHDFYFTRDVDHRALVNVMDAYPNTINYVRFPKRQPHTISRSCGEAPPIKYNRTIVPEGGSNATLTLHPTSVYSDNNHLVRFHWYKKLIASLIKLDRAPEGPLMIRAKNGCRHNPPVADDITGLYLYHEMNIRHLDGRHTAATP